MEPQAPEAHFSANPTSGIAPMTVAFSDESAHTPTGWAWNFGDGGTSTEQHPEYTYTTTGTFTVTQTVSKGDGSDTLTVPDCITVNEEHLIG
jgi:PKD repeat protein